MRHKFASLIIFSSLFSFKASYRHKGPKFQECPSKEVAIHISLTMCKVIASQIAIKQIPCDQVFDDRSNPTTHTGTTLMSGKHSITNTIIFIDRGNEILHNFLNITFHQRASIANENFPRSRSQFYMSNHPNQKLFKLPIEDQFNF